MKKNKKERLLELVERTLDEVMPAAAERPAKLHEAMRYAVGAGGKRIRPLVCLAAAEAVGGKASDAKYPAAAIELLHNYTLIHDDLPAMDNDTMRRGKPTVWKKFGEANAILAGDAMLALAYRVAAMTPRNAARVVDMLGRGGVNVVRGQVEDVAKGRDVDYIYANKTAALFVTAAVMGGLAAGATPAQVKKLVLFGHYLGLAFQYQDDLLDGDSSLDREEVENRANEATFAALASLEKLKGDVSFLDGLVRGLMGRTI